MCRQVESRLPRPIRLPADWLGVAIFAAFWFVSAADAAKKKATSLRSAKALETRLNPCNLQNLDQFLQHG
jgi:hypothetical protein